MKTLVYFTFGAALSLLLAFGVWALSLGGFRDDSSFWLKEILDVKDATAATLSSPKIIMASGSNALFGLDSEMLSKMTGMPVVNMATHGGLPLGLIAERVVNHVKPGDIVVAPLEFEFYRRDPAAPSLFEATNVESWASDYALGTVTRALTYFRSASLLRSLRQLLSPVDIPLVLHGKPNAVEINTLRGIAIWAGYTAASLNAYGDILIDAPSEFEGAYNYISGPPHPRGVGAVLAFKAAVEAEGAQFWLTWPVTARNSLFDLTSMKTRRVVDKLRLELQTKGLILHCDAASFHYPPNMFVDTAYHLGLEGAERRTVALAECLTGRPSLIDPMKLVADRREQAQAFDDSAY